LRASIKNFAISEGPKQSRDNFCEIKVIVGSSDALPLAERAALARGIISIFVFFNYEVSQNKGFLRDSGAVNECGGVKTGKAHRRQCDVADVVYCRAARSCFLSRRSLSRRSLSLVARHRQGAFLKRNCKQLVLFPIVERMPSAIVCESFAIVIFK